MIWRDGRLVGWSDATIHVLSHVVHYGSGIFEGLRCYQTATGGAVFRAHDHMRRFIESCRIYRMPVAYAVDELVQALVDTVAANGLQQCYLRPLAIRTGEQMGVLGTDVPVEIFVIAWRWSASYLGDHALSSGVDTCVSSWRRAAPDTFPTMAKASGNYLSSQLTKTEARLDHYAEGIMLDSFGYVSEGSGENLFLVRDDVLYTSPISAGILRGITRDSIIRIARDKGIEVREENMPREMLYIADELFFCGTAAEITPIRSVDHIQVGAGAPGPITLGLQSEYLGMATGRVPDRFGWLTPVPQPAVSRA
jgi:branched-chain amino acid aminotransferase